MEFVKNLRLLLRVNSVNRLRLLKALCTLPLDYRSPTGRSRSLVNVTLELTYRCNSHCAFCFAPHQSGQDELSLEEISRLIDSVAPLRVGFYLTGGEPLLRIDCVDIIRRIKARGLKVGINTNLHAPTGEQLRELADSGLDYAIVSLHGPKPVHERLTGVAGYDRAVQNMAFLRRQAPHVRLLINTVITAENIAHLPGMVDLAAELKVDALTLQHETFLSPADKERHARRWRELFGEAANPVALDHETEMARIDVGALSESLRAVRERARKKGVAVFVKPLLSCAHMDNWYSDSFHLPAGGRCSYLYTDARISPQGDVICCQSIPQSMGNIRNAPLPEIWNSPEFRAFRNAMKKTGGFLPACARCCKLYRVF